MNKIHEFNKDLQEEIYQMKLKDLIELIKKHPNMKEKELSLYNLIDWVKVYKGEDAAIFRNKDESRFNLSWHETLDAIAFKVYMELYENEQQAKTVIPFPTNDE